MREIKFRAKSLDGIWFCWKLLDLIDMSNLAIDLETIGEDTGVKDQNGKYIYTGDIVLNHSVSRNKSGIVEFSNIHHAYIINYAKTQKEDWDSMHGDEHNLEIIGNIYETTIYPKNKKRVY